MNAKHTPRPWTVVTYTHEQYLIAGAKGQLPYIAVIPDDRLERDANARLIAAAPDLLAALAMIEEHASNNEDAFFPEEARVAIAKAKGEQ